MDYNFEILVLFIGGRVFVSDLFVYLKIWDLLEMIYGVVEFY